MATKNNPGEFDCYKNAEQDEPMFILLARDRQAPALVLAWAMERKRMVEEGQKPADDIRMVAEAIDCASAMIDWRLAKRKLVSLPKAGWFLDPPNSVHSSRGAALVLLAQAAQRCANNPSEDSVMAFINEAAGHLGFTVVREGKKP